MTGFIFTESSNSTFGAETPTETLATEVKIISKIILSAACMTRGGK